MASAAAIVRAAMGSFRIPQPRDKVYRSECAFSFDTPESPGGLFVNLATHHGFGEAYVQGDRQRTGSAVYLHLHDKRVPPAPKAPSEGDTPAPTPVKFGIGIEGGFAADSAKFDVERTTTVVVFTGPPGDSTAVRFAHPAETADLPSILSAVVDAILAHTDVGAAEAQASWEDKALPSKYADALEVSARSALAHPGGAPLLMTSTAHRSSSKARRCARRRRRTGAVRPPAATSGRTYGCESLRAALYSRRTLTR